MSEQRCPASSTDVSTGDPGRQEGGIAWRPLLARAMKLEKHIYASLVRGIARRPAVPEGARGFRYDASVNLVLESPRV